MPSRFSNIYLQKHSTAQHSSSVQRSASQRASAMKCFGWYRYLSFVPGIVDSDTLPLQVSRESLQQHAALKTMKKKLVRKALDMIKKLADAETSFEAEDADSKSQHRRIWLCWRFVHCMQDLPSPPLASFSH